MDKINTHRGSPPFIRTSTNVPRSGTGGACPLTRW